MRRWFSDFRRISRKSSMVTPCSAMWSLITSRTKSGKNAEATVIAWTAYEAGGIEAFWDELESGNKLGLCQYENCRPLIPKAGS
jgi:hypothetical protein